MVYYKTFCWRQSRRIRAILTVIYGSFLNLLCEYILHLFLLVLFLVETTDVSLKSRIAFVYLQQLLYNRQPENIFYWEEYFLRK